MKFFIAALALICITARPSATYAQQSNYAGLDYLHKLQDKRTDSKTSLNKFLSGTATPISLGTPLTLWVAGLATHNKTLKKEALYSLESFACSQALSFGLKSIINKPRPHEADPTLISLKNATNGSFPSGHTSEAFATATSLTLITKKWYVAVPAYTWAYFVGHSRMYLGVHYPADVAGGAVLGIGSSYLCYRLNKWMHKEKKSHESKAPKS